MPDVSARLVVSERQPVFSTHRAGRAVIAAPSHLCVLTPAASRTCSIVELVHNI